MMGTGKEKIAHLTPLRDLIGRTPAIRTGPMWVWFHG
jgi:hypothetical protein